ncbi:hypothetical protein PHLCEN_2v2239 [Hermanssonia centrifuga]|uniref:Cyclin N-terminal domain-containing protein n=1 Tax=Hermanssonia centrifuga TaxID=98765 RepID=A0A2R6RPQ2_9APHY|nr:hypothetical protein PHLCEN_2v2239 [Hermanssonia centrifuga]
MAHLPSAGVTSQLLRIHPASRVMACEHNPALMEMLAVPVDEPFIDYVVDCVVATVREALDRSWDRSCYRDLKDSTLIQLVRDVLRKAGCPAPTIYVALVYLNRARTHLEITHGVWACERVFLGAMVIAQKVRILAVFWLPSIAKTCISQYTNDGHFSAKSWALASGMFSARDITVMERELLFVLQFHLGVTQHDIVAHYSAIMTRCVLPPINRAAIMASAERSYRAGCYESRHHSSRGVRDTGYSYSSSYSPSSTSSSSSIDSPPVRTPESYAPSLGTYSVPPRDKYLDYSNCHNPPYLLSEGYLETLVLPPPQDFLSHSMDFDMQSSMPPLGFVDTKIYADASLPNLPYALADLLSGTETQSKTLPHISEVLPPSLIYPSGDGMFAWSERSQVPPQRDEWCQPPQLAMIPHSFGDLAYAF